MPNFTENRFNNWTKMLRLDFDPSIFTKLYLKYTNDFSAIIEDLLKDLSKEIKTKFPDVDFYIKGRFKSETSYIYKTFLRLNSNISLLFDDSISNAEREPAIQTFFGFLKDKEKFEYIKNQILNEVNNKYNVSNIDDLNIILQNFKKILNSLSQPEKDAVIRRLGKTEDIFAYRVIVKSVSFDIKDITTSEDGTIKLIDHKGNELSVSPSVKLSSNDIYENAYGRKCALIDGVETELYDNNFLYDSSVPAKKRTFENAKKDTDGNYTLLRDAFVLSDGTHLDITSIYYSPEYESYFFESNGERKNLSSLINGSSIKLKKHDSQTCIEYAKKIDTVDLEFQKKYNYMPMEERRKNYIDYPKPNSGYQSIHNSFYNFVYNFIIENQVRTNEMEEASKMENSKTGHDEYKKDKMLKKTARRPILGIIKKSDPTAFDSSASTTMVLLSKNFSQIELYEVLPKYILVAPIGDYISSYVPNQDVVFNHFFAHIPKEKKAEIKKLTGIDFTNFKSYLSSIQVVNGDSDGPEIT